ncbi:MAG: adenylyltransferase/cytidyltransferase family protein [Candidatus Accumulibacter sp.]|nr:adenylyltransferase/cytidyltransferase family protein [Accumulibacter sp.]
MSTESLVERLVQERDFEKYLDLLAQAASRYCVFVTSHDTPCGSPDFTEALAAKLCRALGTQVLLHDKFRCSYIVAIDEGKLLYENISPNTPIEFRCEIDGIPIRIRSEGFQKAGNFVSCIEIDDFDDSLNDRGLRFVVFCKKKKDIVDYVRFDTYEQAGIITIRGKNNIKSEWCAFYKRNPDVIFMKLLFPKFPASHLSKNEKFILENGLRHSSILMNVDKPISAISEYIHDAEGLYEVLSPPKSYIRTDGARRFFDQQRRYVNIENGHRITLGQPEMPKRSIWFVGGCNFFGVGSRDVGTIPSFLQMLLNKYASEHVFAVHNYGYYLWDVDVSGEALAIMNSLPINPGDIVFGARHIPIAAIANGSAHGERPHDFGELFWDWGHCTENANALLAQIIFDTLSEHNFFAEEARKASEISVIPKPAQNVSDNIPENYGLSSEQLESLETYKSGLSGFYRQQFEAQPPQCAHTPVVGSIVMNCNPFTLGHRYLIEQASAKVDLLVVFVVQEDKSFFPFQDRIDLVYKGIEDLQNVAIVGSGNFIISTMTFSEYFNKAELQDVIVDSSNDVTLFAKEIAPAMHISVRFAGSEPFDRVTKQYNDTLSVILPRYGIRFEELPRLERDGEAISASRVRELLTRRDWDAIARLVPKTTFDYLREKFG